MAILFCADDNFDQESKVAFDIELLDQVDNWLNYKLEFHVGTRIYEFSSKQRQVESYVGTKGEVGKFAFALSPRNEFEVLLQSLRSFIDNNSQKNFRFEPSDPSFELEIARVADQFKVYVWVDAGNSTQLAYTWDALGIRLMTTKEHLLSFVAELENVPITAV